MRSTPARDALCPTEARLITKICGICARDAAEAAGAADYIGFVFFPASPRAVTPAEAAALCPAGAAAVGLFVDPADDEIAAALAALSLAALQLYAPPARVRAVRARFGLPVWRSVAVAGRADLPADGEGADALVVEPRPPAGATRPGGNALALDWAMLEGWDPGVPWLLAGGLTPDNVAAAIRASGARGVDVSSGVETAPAVKSPALIRAFIAAARGASAGSAAGL